ncbi:MAG: WYL domain-containing protein [Lachnospiraceae bacterium]|nr:WYL domain-containing protein [Lachnospiraceae bacterium]
MREFYVYGFKSRDEYTKKSGRSYDDERRRIESWLGDHMQFRQTQEGKNVFISIDSRTSHHNPLYKAWKTKSFTDGDITLHFILMDILVSADSAISISEIAEQVDMYVSGFDTPRTFDESTIRKKLKEYIAEGIIETEKEGKTLLYKIAPLPERIDEDLLDFFSEVAPCGVIGSFILDKQNERDEEKIAFKHHYITGALDSEILYSLFEAIHEKKAVTIEIVGKNKEAQSEVYVIPLQIRFSAQSGRQYLMAYMPRMKRIRSYRLDGIISVKTEEACEQFDELRETLNGMQVHMWGVSTQSRFKERLEHVDFTIRYGDGEQFIHRRLEREKRCGTVEKIDFNTSRFSADIFDSSELIPWIRTFICRITEINFSNKEIEERFKKDIEDMYSLYGLEGGEKT